MSPGHESRTACPRAACTREGSEPARLTLESGTASAPGTAPSPVCPILSWALERPEVSWEPKLQKPVGSGSRPPALPPSPPRPGHSRLNLLLQQWQGW